MTPVEGERLEKIRANAAFATEELGEARGAPIAYDEESVRWVEGFIERSRANYGPEGAPEGIVAVLGCWLGEAIIDQAGGTWADSEDGGLGVEFPNGDAVFPMTKVAKQFAEGVAAGESILSFYTVAVSYVAIGGLRDPANAAGASS
jgi:hypothetical protein